MVYQHEFECTANTGDERAAMASEFELSMYGSGLFGAPVMLIECLLERCGLGRGVDEQPTQKLSS